MTWQRCNTTAVAVLLLLACSGSPAVDAGIDAGAAPDACPAQCNSRGTCSKSELDGPCMQQCDCAFGELTNCVTVCPQAKNCEQGAFCDRGSRTACGTDDAGCTIECGCYSYLVMRYARCATRCGGQAFDCDRMLYQPDAGCAEVTRCAFATQSCQCAPDAGWACTP